MAHVSITITKASVFASVESLLYKYGASIEAADNYRQVFNTQSDSANDTLDNATLTASYGKRTKEAVSLLKDFSPSVSTNTTRTAVTITVTSRWNGSADMLQGALERYVEDGMMADWLNVTAPGESSIYTNRLQQDIADINQELYTKGAPS